MRFRTLFTMSASRRRKLGFAATVMALLGLASGCTSAGKSNYMRHLNTSLKPSQVAVGPGATPTIAPITAAGRLVAAVDAAKSTDSR